MHEEGCMLSVIFSTATVIRPDAVLIMYTVHLQLFIISLHIRSMWETTVMHKQVSGCTVNFGPNFPESPFLESQTRKPPPPPHFGKLQIWDDQSLLRNTPEYPPPFRKTSDLAWPKFTLEYPPRRFKNAESYYMWRLYPTGITTRSHSC